MNKIKNIGKFLFATLFATAFVSCNGDDYSVGAQVSANCPEVYFLETNIVNAELDGMVEGDKTINLTLGRNKATEALTVPINITFADKGLVIPSTVQFEAGSATAELKISYTAELEYSAKSTFNIFIADNELVNPYSTTNPGTVTFQGSLTVWGKWEFLAEADVTITDFSTSSPPAFQPYKQKIYKRGSNQYYIEDFCLNGKGINFSFTTNGIYINADKGCGYHDTSRWYFYDAEAVNDPNGVWDQDKYRIIGYLPNEQNEYLRYFYFYLSGSYYNFVFNEASKTATMCGYARYRAASSGRFTLKFSW